jgi:hypothetical protein
MDIEDLYPEIRRQARGCPEQTMQDALLRAAQQFCTETWFLRRQYAFTSAAGQQQYTLQPPANEECIAVKHAQITGLAPGNSITPLRFVYPTLVNPNVGQQRPYAICFIPYETVALVPPPDNAYPVLLELVTQPASGTTVIADELGVQYRRALGYGALEWLQRMPGDPWFNPQLAVQNLQLFNAEIARARGAAAFDFTPNQRSLLRAGFARAR